MPAPVGRETLGEWCLRKGMATSEEIDSCLRIQRAAELEGRPVPRLGEILVARGILTHHQVAEALAAQRQEIRHCSRCGIQVNVPVRGDAADYRCGRCQGPLKAPAGTPELHAVDEPFILVSKDPVPPEVDLAMRNPANRFGKYVLLRLLGEGGIGAVYLAWDTYLSQFVALKRLRTARRSGPQDTPNEHIQSLLKEARNAIRLRHPGVVSVFDVGRIGREYYVAMEYLQGETLADRIQDARGRGRPSPFYEHPRETLAQLVEIARAVAYGHGRPSPIVHCDLKPANILIDLDGHAHVLDFGLARNLELDKPEKGEISGTPSYMAPEQASGDSDKIDRRTDVYAFGSILYEMLTGRPPFVGGTIEILGKTIGDEPDRPSDTLRKSDTGLREYELSTRALLRIPPALEELCMTCLKKNRDARPQSMDAVAEALESTFRPAKPDPETPKPVPPASSLSTPGLPERSRRPLRRAVLFAVAAGVILGGSALVLSLVRPAAGGPSFEDREAEVLESLSEFHPHAARAMATKLRDESRGSAFEARASRLVEESTWVARLQDRVADRLAGRPLDCEVLRLRRGVAAGIRILGADSSGLRMLQAGKNAELPWEQFDPSQLIAFLEAALENPEESDLLGLGILCFRMGLGRDADRCFDRLRNSALAPIAERYPVSSPVK